MDNSSHQTAFLYPQVPQFHLYQDGVEAMDFESVIPSHGDVSTALPDYNNQQYLSYDTTPSLSATSSRSSSSISSNNPSPASTFDIPAMYGTVPIELPELSDGATASFKWNNGYSSSSDTLSGIHMQPKAAENQSAWYYTNDDFLMSPDVMNSPTMSPPVSRPTDYPTAGLDMPTANASYMQHQMAAHQHHQAQNAPLLSQPTMKRDTGLTQGMGMDMPLKAATSQQQLQQQQPHQKAVRFVNTMVPSSGRLPSSRQSQSSKIWGSTNKSSNRHGSSSGSSGSSGIPGSKPSSQGSSSHKSSGPELQRAPAQASPSRRDGQSQSKHSGHSHSSHSSHSGNSGGGGSSSNGSHHGRKQYICRHKHCDGPVFTRMADLQRHERHIHSDEQDKDHFYCDYPRCSRRDAPFHRKDHFREHLREYHIEDILKRGSNSNGHRAPFSPQVDSFGRAPPASVASPGSSGGLSPASAAALAAAKKSKKPFSQEEWLQECYIDPTWWRCARCLGRVVVAQEGWACPECSGEIEPARRAIRESALKRMRAEGQ